MAIFFKAALITYNFNVYIEFFSTCLKTSFMNKIR